ncbi:acetyl esterase [Natronospira proteinivora]|uniref:Acetyl esterase n=1 Tax=Natronospira proteinivora TaxID=1807133 RepID=A0ABT1G8N4_9GAMM|nr:alpha/beta hydrolase [Natronospira proteinivora]MCP1727591.1 acetyl esterase [Natronospira proteinivora]
MIDKNHQKKPATDGLDAEIREFMDIMIKDAAGHPPLDELPLPEARNLAEKLRTPWRKGGPEMTRALDCHAPTRHGPIRLRVHYPHEVSNAPALVYLHGGGWTLFSLETHDRLMREYAHRTGITVIGVDYSLSPESKYPTALHQICDVLAWLPDQANSLGIDIRKLAIGGDSAGANLALSSCLMLRDNPKGPLIRGMVLNYGAFDYEISRQAEQAYGQQNHMLGADEMRQYWRNYIRDINDLKDPLVCPLHADLHDLPPAFLVIPECDVLTEQNLRMAERLRAAGVDAIDRVYPGTTHSFLEAISIAPVSDRALYDTANWLKQALKQDMA